MKVSDFYKIVLAMYREYVKRYPQSNFAKECLQDFEEAYELVKDCTEEFADNDIASHELVRHSRLAYALRYNPDLSFKSLKHAKYGKFPVLMGTIYGIPTLLRAIRAAKKV